MIAQPPESLRMVLGLPFHALTMEQMLDTCVTLMRQPDPSYLVTANVDFALRAHEDAEFRDIIFHADCMVCDGQPLIWQSHRLGAPLPERVAGSDLIPRLMARCAEHGFKVFFFGSDPATLAKAKSRLEALHPAIRIVGCKAPPMAPIDDWDNEAICEAVNTSEADLLLLAISSPKQEFWYHRHREHLQVPLSIGIGASLDFIAGKQTRAPRWMHELGLEWGWRLATDPVRLSRRYLRNIRFYFPMRKKERTILERNGGCPEPVSLPSTEDGIWKLRDLPAEPVFVTDRVIIDGAEEDHIDIATIARLAGWARAARRTGNHFRCINMPEAFEHYTCLHGLQAQFGQDA